MFDSLLIHPRTRLQLEQFVASPSHGLILTGPEGTGKKTLASAVTAAVLGVEHAKLYDYPYYSLIDPKDPTITIDEVRALQKLLTLRTPKHGNQVIRRAITIIDAGRMRTEAQNAFLKSLEEPPVDTCIILTAEANGNLLQTIYSRVQRIDILPVSEAAANEYYSQKGISPVDIAKNYALSQGQVGLLDSLLHSSADHVLKAWVEVAKGLLAKPAGDRLLDTEGLSKDKTDIALLLNALQRIVHAALFAASKSGNVAAIKKWKKGLEALQFTDTAMQHNANTKLMLDNLFLNL